MPTSHRIPVKLIWGGRTSVRADGVIDRQAIKAFTQGQCHALALAIHYETSWPIYGIWSKYEGVYGSPSHCLVYCPKLEEFLDIQGAGCKDRLASMNWESAKMFTPAEVKEFEEYLEPNIEAAKPFVKAVLSTLPL